MKNNISNFTFSDRPDKIFEMARDYALEKSLKKQHLRPYDSRTKHPYKGTKIFFHIESYIDNTDSPNYKMIKYLDENNICDVNYFEFNDGRELVVAYINYHHIKPFFKDKKDNPILYNDWLRHKYIEKFSDYLKKFDIETVNL